MADPLRTSRLSLRPPVMADAPAVAALADDAEVARWTARLPHPYTLADAEDFLANTAPDAPTWAVERDGTLVGMIGLDPRGADRVFELGYWVGRRHWGQGYATEAARAVTDYAFGTLDAPFLISGHFKGNPASGRVLEKVGFAETGTSRQYSCFQDGELAHRDMRLDRARWRSAC